MKLNKLIAITLFLYPTFSFAVFCPTNFNQINIGDTIDQVQAQCGKPDVIDKKEKEPPVPQEWSYYLQQNVSNGAQQMQGTLKTTFAFDKDGKSINISVNGIGVGSTSVCNGVNLPLGATRDDVKTACGEPINIDKQTTNASGDSVKPTEVITYLYNSNPPHKLIFEDGKLTSME